MEQHEALAFCVFSYLANDTILVIMGFKIFPQDVFDFQFVGIIQGFEVHSLMRFEYIVISMKELPVVLMYMQEYDSNF